MKLNATLPLVLLAIFYLAVTTTAKDDGKGKDTTFIRLLQRRVGRTRTFIDILLDSEKSHAGAENNAIQDRFQREVRDQLNQLIGRDKTVSSLGDDQKEQFKRRRVDRIKDAINRIEKQLTLNEVREKRITRVKQLRSALDALTRLG